MSSPYAAMFGSRSREELQYRAAAFAGLFTQVVFGLIISMVLLAFYASSASEAPMTMTQLLAYVWLSQAMFAMLPWNVDPVALDSIRTGEVVHELLRPVDIYSFWAVRVLAWRVVRTLLRAVPMVLLAMIVFPHVGLARYAMPPPASVGAFALFVPAVLASVSMSVALTVLMQVVMLWMVSSEGVLRFLPTVVLVFAGNLVPLPLLPDWMQPFLEVQPFRGITDTPYRIYGGHLTGAAAWSALAWSLGWIAVMIGLGRSLLARGMKRLAVAGG